MATTVRTLSTLNFSENLDNQYLYITNTLNNQDTKLRLSDLVRSFKTSGSGVSLIADLSNAEVNFKNLSSRSQELSVDDGNGGVQIRLVSNLLDLSKCNNTKSLFLSTVDLTKNVGTTILPTANGGTGKATTHVVGDILYADTTTTLNPLAAVATGNVLISAGTGTAPVWGKVALGTSTSGSLGVANGGTGLTTVASRSVLTGNDSGALTATAAATAGQILIGSNAGNPAFAALGTDGTIIATTGNNTLSLAARVQKLELADGTDMLVTGGTNTSTATGKTFSYLRNVSSITTATKVPSVADSGTIYTLDRAEGIAVTLPGLVPGLVFEFHITTTFTGNLTITSAGSGQCYTGSVKNIDKDEKGSVVALNEGIDTTGWNIPGLTDYILTLDGDTDGRFIGGKLKFTGLSTTKWHIEGTLFGDGTVSHIFS
tara:strand:- start:13586 stop:14875 length:1290 start_codon:yes stop_codon:yes gene_type:complete